MKPRVQNSFNLKYLLFAFFLLFLLLFVLRSSFSSAPVSPPASSSSAKRSASASLAEKDLRPSSSSAGAAGSCAKIPPSLADALIHYTTTNVTPQQTIEEIQVTERVLERKSPCNFLVFGLGRDSLMWSALNHGGRTVFLEEDESWIGTIGAKFPSLESYHVRYDTKLTQAEELLRVGRLPECAEVGDARSSRCGLALRELPAVFYEVEWDLIMVDAPTGWTPEAPGRMGAIYTAGMAARARSEGETDVFVHDVDRDVEDRFSKAFLCEGYLKEQEGRLRHFTIPSHRENQGLPFCP